MNVALNVIIVFLFGSLWGLAELLLRYKEWHYLFNCQKKSVNTLNNTEVNVGGYVISYIILNGIISIIALSLIKFFAKGTLDEVNGVDIIIAGFGGMVILRSSMFSIKHNKKDIEIGLATIVQIFLDTIDRKINHNIAARRVCNIYEIMKEVNFDLAKEELPSLCIEFIDNFTQEDSDRLKNKITQIANVDISGINKSMQLGREIALYCDEEILMRAIKKLPHILQRENQPLVDEFEKRKLQLENSQINQL